MSAWIGGRVCVAYVVIGVVVAGGMVGVVVLGRWLEGRRRGRIEEWMRGRGGRVMDVRVVPASWRRMVRYVGAEGALRMAEVEVGKTVKVYADRAYQEVLREKFAGKVKGRQGEVKLDDLLLAVEVGKLPGAEVYREVMRELAAGAGEVVIDEGDEGRRRFAPVLQCLEAQAIGLEPERALELRVDGNDVDVRWEVRGETPRRRLVVSGVRRGKEG